MLNDLVLQWGLQSWHPVLSALALPPVPLLLLMLFGAVLARRRAFGGTLLLLAGAAGIWLSSTVAVGEALQRSLLAPARALSLQNLKDLQAARKQATAIVVLGGGRESYAPEYGGPSLSDASMQRLRYGLWLSRETALPVAFSGGAGHAQTSGPAEAQVAATLAARDFNRPLKWVEDGSRDTRENAARTVALLQAAGVQRIVLVTHGWHLRRAMRAFEQAAAARGGSLIVMAAPMGLARSDLTPALRWLPSSAGFKATRQALHEYAGLWLGA